MQVERYAAALEHLRSAVELKADNPAAWFDYGQTLQLNGDTRAAHKAYHSVIDLDESGEIAERARTALKEKLFFGDTRSLIVQLHNRIMGTETEKVRGFLSGTIRL